MFEDILHFFGIILRLLIEKEGRDPNQPSEQKRRKTNLPPNHFHGLFHPVIRPHIIHQVHIANLSLIETFRRMSSSVMNDGQLTTVRTNPILNLSSNFMLNFCIILCHAPFFWCSRTPLSKLTPPSPKARSRRVVRILSFRNTLLKFKL